MHHRIIIAITYDMICRVLRVNFAQPMKIKGERQYLQRLIFNFFYSSMSMHEIMSTTLS